MFPESSDTWFSKQPYQIISVYPNDPLMSNFSTLNIIQAQYFKCLTTKSDSKIHASVLKTWQTGLYTDVTLQQGSMETVCGYGSVHFPTLRPASVSACVLSGCKGQDSGSYCVSSVAPEERLGPGLEAPC